MPNLNNNAALNELIDLVETITPGSIDLTPIEALLTSIDAYSAGINSNTSDVSTLSQQVVQSTKLDSIKTSNDTGNTLITSSNTKLDAIKTSSDGGNTLITASNAKLEQIRASIADGAGTNPLLSSINSKLLNIQDNTSNTLTALLLQATAALQTTGNTSLSTIATNTSTNNTLTTSSNTKLDTINTTLVENNRGTIGTNTSVTALGALNSGSQSLVAQDLTRARKSVYIFNNTNRTIYVLFGAGTANTTTTFSTLINSGIGFEVPKMFCDAAISFSISQNSATNTIQVTTAS